MAFLRPYLAFRLFFSGAALLVILDAKENATLEFGCHAAAALSSLAASDFQSEALSLLQVQVRWPSQAPSLYPQSWRESDREGGRAGAGALAGVGAEVGARVKAVATIERRPLKQRVVWINAFPRSGSTLLLSLVSQVDFPVFTLFEPCAKYDEVAPWLSKEGCGAVLSQLAQCNFTGIINLQHWKNSGTLKNGASEVYSPESASVACKSAGLVVFKTVTWGHNVASEAIPFLQANPQVYALDVVRDPRSMYASAMFAEDFYTDPEKGHNVEELIDLCDSMYRSIEASHPRMLRVVYEKFVTKPEETAKSIFSFIATPAEKKQGLSFFSAAHVNLFLNSNFNANNCEDSSSYSICKQDSMKPLERYKTLPYDMSQVFRTTQSCIAVAQFYGYDLNDGLRLAF
mmetsp:Transcript_147114/g.256740  ORF Transcript_147114/g.256740 Transcript_147114/m.256740 type:complete len:402 (+) Transcript_147114:76-1281(+)